MTHDFLTRAGFLVSAAIANCYVVIPPEEERLAAGEMVRLLIRPS